METLPNDHKFLNSNVHNGRYPADSFITRPFITWCARYSNYKACKKISPFIAVTTKNKLH